MSGTAEQQHYVLFEFLDAVTVTFRRSDMEYPDIRRQFLELLRYFLGVEMTAEEWWYTLARAPDDWGDFLGFSAGEGENGRATATLFKAEREPGVNSGENGLITSIASTAKQ